MNSGASPSMGIFILNIKSQVYFPSGNKKEKANTAKRNTGSISVRFICRRSRRATGLLMYWVK